jgi:hypothetical protein
VNGDNTNGSIGGIPFLTIEHAIDAIVNAPTPIGPGVYTIWVHPGVYDIENTITIPNNTCLRGQNVATTTIQLLGAKADETLIIMGENCLVEDLTLFLQCGLQANLKGVEFPDGTLTALGTTASSKLRNCVLIVDNTNVTDITNVYGVEANGTGTLSPDSFSFNCIENCTITVKSNGEGNKRGILVSGTNIMSIRDTNIYVAAPIDPTLAGSYVGVETNDTTGPDLGSIQIRNSAISVVRPAIGDAYTASDILQTTPPAITEPTDRTAPGIQIGPGVDLLTKSAGSYPFNLNSYTTSISYSLRGLLANMSSSGYLWPGTNEYPDTDTPLPSYLIREPTILRALSCELRNGPPPEVTSTVTVNVQYESFYDPQGIIDTGFNTAFQYDTATSTISNYYSTSLSLYNGDRIYVHVSSTGGSLDTAKDLSVRLHMY